MEFLLIYLFMMVGKIGMLFMFGWVPLWVGVIITFFCLLGAAMTTQNYPTVITFKDNLDSYGNKLVRKWAKVAIIFGFVTGVIGFLIPSQKDLAIIVASGVTYNVLTSEPAQRIGGKALSLLEQKIDEALSSEVETGQPTKKEGIVL